MYNPFGIQEWPGQYRYVSFGGKKASSSPTRLKNWSPEQWAVFRPLASIIQKGIAEPVPAYPGRLYVPRTPEEEAYFSRTPEIAEQIAQVRARLGQSAYQITPETTEQLYQQAIRAPMLKEWQEIVEPQIRESYVGPGYWGSARAQAQTKAAEDLATTLGARRAELAYADEIARRAALEQAAAREATYSLPYATTEVEMLGRAGELARSIEQQRTLADLQRWLMGETVEGVMPIQYNPFIQLAFQLLGLSPYSYGQKSSSGGFGFAVTAPGMPAPPSPPAI